MAWNTWTEMSGNKKKLGERNKERFKTCYLTKQVTYLQNVLFHNFVHTVVKCKEERCLHNELPIHTNEKWIYMSITGLEISYKYYSRTNCY